MPAVIFVAPYLLPATLRFLGSLASLEGVRVGLVTQDLVSRVPEPTRRRLRAFLQVRSALDPQEIADAVRTLAPELGGADRLLGALEELQVPLGMVRDLLGIPGMDAATARNFRDKARMKTVLREAGIPCARHALASSPAEAQAFVAATGYPVVLKPPAGAGARGTVRVEDQPGLLRALAEMSASPERPVLLEEFMTGEEHSFDSVFLEGEPVWHSINDYQPSPLTVVENPWIQWAVLLPREIDGPRYDPIRAAAIPALKALGMRTGLSHMEWFRRSGDSVAISEVGARPPGAQFMSLISYAHDRNFYRAWAELMVFERFDPPSRVFSCGAVYLRGMGSGTVREVHGLAQAQQEFGALVVEARLPEIGQPSASSYEGEGFVILRHPETEVVADALRRLVATLRVELI